MITTVLALSAGGATWVVAEYQLHRFVGHGRGKNAFAAEHRRHHAVGDYFAPSSKKALHVTPVFVAVAILASILSDPTSGTAYGLGLAAAYLAYELLHRRLHTHPPGGMFGRWARRHHFYHHFHDPRRNHGVSTALFDRIFRTRAAPPEKVRVPERLAMRWLVDPQTREVRPEYQRDYELARLSPRSTTPHR